MNIFIILYIIVQRTEQKRYFIKREIFIQADRR